MAEKSAQDLVEQPGAGPTDHPQSGTEAPRRDARDLVGGGELGDNKPIGDPGNPTSIKGVATPTKQG